METVDKAAGDAKAAVAESASSKEKGSSGTVKLDRPKEVQYFFLDGTIIPPNCYASAWLFAYGFRPLMPR